MRKLLIVIFMALFTLPIFAQHEEIATIELELGERVLEMSTSRAKPLYIDFGKQGIISFNENSSRILLWHLNNLIEIMNLVDESSIDIPYTSEVNMMYSGPYTSKRISFRVRIHDDGRQISRIGVLEEVALDNFFLSRAEIEEFISSVESAIQRHEDIVSQVVLLNEEIDEIY